MNKVAIEVTLFIFKYITIFYTNTTMENRVYSLPLNFEKLKSKNKELNTCTLEHSIAQNCFVIITSKYNEHRFDSNYGNEIWEKDFELIADVLKWQEQMNVSIKNTIAKYEPRLENIKIDTIITEEKCYSVKSRIYFLKKKIVVNITGIIKNTGMAFKYSPNLFLSPLTVSIK